MSVVDLNKHFKLALWGKGLVPTKGIKSLFKDRYTKWIHHILYNPKSEKFGTVWKTQIKKESSDF